MASSKVASLCEAAKSSPARVVCAAPQICARAQRQIGCDAHFQIRRAARIAVFQRIAGFRSVPIVARLLRRGQIDLAVNQTGLDWLDNFSGAQSFAVGIVGR